LPAKIQPKKFLAGARLTFKIEKDKIHIKVTAFNLAKNNLAYQEKYSYFCSRPKYKEF
jgi:hypothetical protein